MLAANSDSLFRELPTAQSVHFLVVEITILQGTAHKKCIVYLMITEDVAPFMEMAALSQSVIQEYLVSGKCTFYALWAVAASFHTTHKQLTPAGIESSHVSFYLKQLL